MLEGGTKNTRGNVALWIAGAMLSMIGLGANVYKYNTGVEPKLDWMSISAEAVILLAAVYFIYDYFRSKRKEKEEEQTK